MRLFDVRNMLRSTCSPQKKLAVARIGDAHLAEHLPDDDLDVLVVDRHTLQAIDFLHLRDEEIVERRGPEDLEDLVRVGRAFGEVLAFVHDVAGLHDDVLAGRDEVLLLLRSLLVADTSLRLPRTVPANETMPSMRAISAASFGRRASNSSATRGRPPVMSLVLEAWRGVLASSAPGEMWSLSATTIAHPRESSTRRAGCPSRREFRFAD